MFDFIIQEFSWTTFFLALALFILLSNIFNLIKAYAAKGRAQKEADLAEKKLAELQSQLRNKEKELNKIMQKEKR